MYCFFLFIAVLTYLTRTQITPPASKEENNNTPITASNAPTTIIENKVVTPVPKQIDDSSHEASILTGLLVPVTLVSLVLLAVFIYGHSKRKW